MKYIKVKLYYHMAMICSKLRRYFQDKFFKYIDKFAEVALLVAESEEMRAKIKALSDKEG